MTAGQAFVSEDFPRCAAVLPLHDQGRDETVPLGTFQGASVHTIVTDFAFVEVHEFAPASFPASHERIIRVFDALRYPL